MANTYKIGNGNQVVIPDNPTTTEMLSGREKARRNNYLSESDWTQISDNGMTSAKKDKWKTYRQELRDLDTSTDPKNITWPTKP